MILLAWYFLAVSLLPYGGAGVTQIGPFDTRQSAEGAMHFIRAQQGPTKYPVVLYGPWEVK